MEGIEYIEELNNWFSKSKFYNTKIYTNSNKEEMLIEIRKDISKYNYISKEDFSEVLALLLPSNFYNDLDLDMDNIFVVSSKYMILNTFKYISILDRENKNIEYMLKEV